MNAGVMLFAFDSDKINYTKIAAWSAARVHRHLEMPVCLVTDRDTDTLPAVFDHVITVPRPGLTRRYFDDIGDSVDWFNQGRCDAFHLTPYDRTLVLDVDYVINSSQLSCLVNASNDFLCHIGATDVATGQALSPSFGRGNIPMSWATVMMFGRNRQAEMIFDCMRMVQQNWQHYRDLYGIDRPTYRNDHALSIARLLANGHWTSGDHIPWTLASVIPGHELKADADADTWRVDHSVNGRARWLKISHQDFHAMGKSFLEAAIHD
jgi:hypothetical protein